MFTNPNVGTMMTQVNLGQMVEQVGVAIAKAQMAMDSVGVELLERLSSYEVTFGKDKDGKGGTTRTLLELGFMPTFYGITEVTLEAKIAISTSTSEEFSASSSVRVGNPFSIAAATVDASYSNKYSFSAEASSTLKARFVALPPPLELRQAVEKMKPGAAPAGATGGGGQGGAVPGSGGQGGAAPGGGPQGGAVLGGGLQGGQPSGQGGIKP